MKKLNKTEFWLGAVMLAYASLFFTSHLKTPELWLHFLASQGAAILFGIGLAKIMIGE